MTQYPKSIPALDGIRGLAALIVVFSHFSTLQPDFFGGWLGYGAAHIGVMLFFVLSGFLLGHLYFGREATLSNICDFFRKRIARVMPMYWAVVAISFFIVAVSRHWHPFWYATRKSSLLDHLLLIRADSVLWTVVVETNFYLLFPLFWVVARRGGKYLIVLGLALMTLNLVIDTPTIAAKTLRVFSGAGNCFIAGLLLSVMPRVPTENYRAVMNSAFLLTGSLVILAYPKVSAFVSNDALGCATNACIARMMSSVYEGYVYLPVVCAFLYAAVNSAAGSAFFSSPVMRWFGKISYSLYLLHMIAIWYWRRFTMIEDYTYVYFIVAFGTMLIASTVTYRYVERPARDWINRVGISHAEVSHVKSSVS